MKRTEIDVSCQLSERDWLIRMVIQILSRSFNPFFCLGTRRRLWTAAQAGTISCRLCQLRRIEKRHMVASRAARGTRRAAIDTRGGHCIDEPAIAAAIAAQHSLPRRIYTDRRHESFPHCWAMIPPEQVEALSDCCGQTSGVVLRGGTPRAVKRELRHFFAARSWITRPGLRS